jgi:hypothetical protein
MPEVNVQATIRAVGTSAVLVASLGALYGIAALAELEPWLRVVFAVPPSALIVSGAVWMISGGEQGTHVEIHDGERRFSIKNLNVMAHAIARAALEAFRRAPLPRPAGEIKGSPADPASIVEGHASLPATVESTEKPIDLPPDAKGLS